MKSEHESGKTMPNSFSDCTRVAMAVEKLLHTINTSQVGYGSVLEGPYGTRRVVYTDYTASGRALTFIEDYIREEVLCYYGNTHTTTSITSRKTTFFREEARLIIRNAVNASEKDCVVFAGSGCTGAVHKLVHALHLTNLPQPPVVFVSPFEHHSNLLPWREIGAEVVMVAEDENGCADIHDLESKLKHYAGSGRQLIGAFNAASNITGVLTDTNAFSATLHSNGALALWDFATAAPYTDIDMNPVVVSADRDDVYKDAVFFSMHKFVGGPDSPGVLVAKKELFVSPTPHSCGGGTVFFVTPSSHRYFKEVELREEGGTPAIVGSVRAGLAMQLKEAVGTEVIMAREREITRLVLSQWKDVPELVVVGPHSIPRLPVFSFLVRHVPSGRFLHPNYVCALLNDLFGIQARGGCSCAGPYAQRLLGISEELAKKYESIVMEDSRLDRVHLRRYHEYCEQEVLRPGVTRLSFPYFMSLEEVGFVTKAVAMVATDGWKLLPQYLMNPETGLFRNHRHHVSKDRCWLGSISYQTGEMVYPRQPNSAPPTLQEVLTAAREILEKATQSKGEPPSLGDQAVFLSEEAEGLRWFLLPSEAQQCLLQQPIAMATPPFQPRVYPGDGELPDSSRKDERGDSCHATGDSGVVADGAGSSTVDDTQSLVNSLRPSPDVVVPPRAESACGDERKPKFHHPPKKILNPTIEAIEEFGMIQHGDRVLVCLSGGKDSLSLLHTMHQYQFIAKSKGVEFQLAAVTIDPGSSSYNPRPLIPYLAALGVPYFYEEQGILQQATSLPECTSICSFCSRMKRGRLYACARRQGYNVLAMGQHLDDMAESFLMSVFHNGLLRTMKASYTVEEGDLRVIRPFVYVREKELRAFADQVHLPVIPENCPACFEAPKERHRVKQLLAAQELLYPRVFQSLQTAMKPLMARDRTGLEGRRRTQDQTLEQL